MIFFIMYILEAKARFSRNAKSKAAASRSLVPEQKSQVP